MQVDVLPSFASWACLLLLVNFIGTWESSLKAQQERFTWANIDKFINFYSKPFKIL